MNTEQVRIEEKPEDIIRNTSRDMVAPVDRISRTASSTSLNSSVPQTTSPQITPSVSNSSVKDGAIANNSRVSKKTSKKKKNVCYFDKCSSTASKFIGDCNFCKGHFCSKHRLMENHACEGLTSCKEAMHKRNADKLAAEQTRAPKIQI